MNSQRRAHPSTPKTVFTMIVVTATTVIVTATISTIIPALPVPASC
jgi:hypothetical protein